MNRFLIDSEISALFQRFSNNNKYLRCYYWLDEKNFQLVIIDQILLFRLFPITFIINTSFGHFFNKKSKLFPKRIVELRISEEIQWTK